jgi:hypothetical protein
MLHPAPDRAIVAIAHTCHDGRSELLTFRCTIKAVRAPTAIIWRDSKPYCEEVGLDQLTPRPDPATWGSRGDGNNSYIMAQKRA